MSATTDEPNEPIFYHLIWRSEETQEWKRLCSCTDESEARNVGAYLLAPGCALHDRQVRVMEETRVGIEIYISRMNTEIRHMHEFYKRQSNDD